MRKRLSYPSILSIAVIFVAMVYIALMLAYRSVIPRDIGLRILNDSWTIDSVTVIRLIAVQTYAETYDTTYLDKQPWSFDIYLYGQNKISADLTVDSVSLLDRTYGETLLPSSEQSIKAHEAQFPRSQPGNRRFVLKINELDLHHPIECVFDVVRIHRVQLRIYSDRGYITISPIHYETKPNYPQILEDKHY